MLTWFCFEVSSKLVNFKRTAIHTKKITVKDIVAPDVRRKYFLYTVTYSVNNTMYSHTFSNKGNYMGMTMSYYFRPLKKK